jgi:hypothetical protein
VEDQPAARGGGVQRLVQGPEPGAAAAQPGHDGDQVLQGPGQPVQARDDEGVAGAEAVKARGELGTADGLARLLVGEDPDAAGLDQGAGLPVQVLPGRGHAGVPDQRAAFWRRRTRSVTDCDSSWVRATRDIRLMR